MYRRFQRPSIWQDMDQLQREMNRLFDEATQNWNGHANSPNGWSPETDIYETETDLVLQVDLPGFNAKDIDIVVENNVLTIRGERRTEATTEGDNYRRVERISGRFFRRFTLHNQGASLGPVRMVLTRLPRGFRLVGSDRVVEQLAAGETVTFTIQIQATSAMLRAGRTPTFTPLFVTD